MSPDLKYVKNWWNREQKPGKNEEAKVKAWVDHKGGYKMITVNNNEQTTIY